MIHGEWTFGNRFSRSQIAAFDNFNRSKYSNSNSPCSNADSPRFSNSAKSSSSKVAELSNVRDMEYFVTIDDDDDDDDDASSSPLFSSFFFNTNTSRINAFSSDTKCLSAMLNTDEGTPITLDAST